MTLIRFGVIVLLSATLSPLLCHAQQADTGRVLTADQVDITPVLLRQPPPIYSDSLRRAGVGGTVTVSVILDTVGRPELASVRVTATSDSALNASARAMIVGSTFSPARVHGRRVRCLLTSTIHFDPRGTAPPPPPVYTTRDSLDQPPRFSHWRPVSGALPFSSIDSTNLSEVAHRGRILVQLIIDSLGHPDTASIQVVEPADQWLASPVSRYVERMQFTPARLRGRPVRVLVTLPLTFR